LIVIVGGREFNLTRQQVETAMRGVDPEAIREHVVEVLDTVFPPKQVLATVTGWERTSFTTMEAQRVLAKLGFVCRRARPHVPRSMVRAIESEEGAKAAPRDRMALLESEIATAMEAIASLRNRVEILERR
jgi:hypothetical protein